MLELRPTCEHCNKPLPPASDEAVICSFECTFCTGCATGVLGGVCPNCGGNFTARPIRPSEDWNGENCLGKYPASGKVKHRPADLEKHASLLDRLKHIPPQAR